MPKGVDQVKTTLNKAADRWLYRKLEQPPGLLHHTQVSASTWLFESHLTIQQSTLTLGSIRGSITIRLVVALSMADVYCLFAAGQPLHFSRQSAPDSSSAHSYHTSSHYRSARPAGPWAGSTSRHTMTSLADSYQLAMMSMENKQHVRLAAQDGLLRLGSRQDSQATTVSSLASMAQQSSDSGSPQQASISEGYAVGPGRSSDSTLVFPNTLPLADATGASTCSTPRLSSPAQQQQRQFLHQQQQQVAQQQHGHQQYQQSPLNRIYSSQLYSSGRRDRAAGQLVPIMAGRPLESTTEEPDSEALFRSTSNTSSAHSLHAAPSAALDEGDALRSALLRLQQHPYTAAAATYAQDGNLRAQCTANTDMEMLLQQQPFPAGGKPRRASCCVTPDSQYQQRLIQLQLLMEEEQQLQADINQALIQRQLKLKRQQQHQHMQQLRQPQQDQADVVANPRCRRASYYVPSDARHMQFQPQEQQQRVATDLMQFVDQVRLAPRRGRASLDLPARSRRSWEMQVPGPGPSTVDYSRPRRTSLEAIQPAREHMSLPLKLQMLLQQQQQQDMAANAARMPKPRRASCCVIPDSHYQHQLQQDQFQLQMQDEAGQQRKAHLQHVLQQAAFADARRQRRASCCVLPATQQDTAPLAGLEHLGSSSSSSHRVTTSGGRRSSIDVLDVTAMGGAPAAWHANSTQLPSGNVLPPALAAMQQQYLASSLATSTMPAIPSLARAQFAAPRVTAAAVAEEQAESCMPQLAAPAQGFIVGLTGQPLAHTNSGSSSSSSGGTFGQLPRDVALLGCDQDMCEALPAVEKLQQTQLRRNSGSYSIHISNKQGPLRQCSTSSYASDDTMETVGSAGTGLTAAQPGSSRHCVDPFTVVDFAERGADAGAGAGAVSSGFPSSHNSSPKSTLCDSLELICVELQQLLALQARLEQAAAVALPGSAAAAACDTAQARNTETIQCAVAAKVALEAATSASSDSMDAETYQQDTDGTMP